MEFWVGLYLDAKGKPIAKLTRTYENARGAKSAIGNDKRREPQEIVYESSEAIVSRVIKPLHRIRLPYRFISYQKIDLGVPIVVKASLHEAGLLG